MKHLALQTEAYRVILTEFTRYISARGFSGHTKDDIPAVVQEFLFALEKHGVFSVAFVKPTHVQEHYDYISHRPNMRRPTVGLSASMITQHVYGLRVFFSWLEQLGALSLNPMTCLQFPKLYSPPRVALLLSAIEELYNHTETQLDRALLGLFYGCGLRRSEAASLDIRDVNWSGARVIVRHGKFNKRREVPLHSTIMKDLRSYYKEERPQLLWPTRPTKAFLVNTCGDRLEGKRANVRIQQLAKLAEIEQDVSLHVLRHSIATHLLDRGMSLEQIRQFLGHGSLDVTERYVLGSQKSWRQRKSVYTKNQRKFYQA